MATGGKFKLLHNVCGELKAMSIASSPIRLEPDYQSIFYAVLRIEGHVSPPVFDFFLPSSR